MICASVLAETKVIVVPLLGNDIHIIPTYKSVFVTKGTYVGSFGAAENADAICLAEAEAKDSKVKGKNWLAWVSGNIATEFADDGQRFTKTVLPYHLVSGEAVATDFSNLVGSPGLNHPIDSDATGEKLESHFFSGRRLQLMGELIPAIIAKVGQSL